MQVNLPSSNTDIANTIDKLVLGNKGQNTSLHNFDKDTDMIKEYN